jgi:Protein of unknown function (DUF1553)/Protein of unknown function (DUF1549)
MTLARFGYAAGTGILSAAALTSAGLAEAPAPWAFEPVRDPTPPTLVQADRMHRPIDQFVLAKLEAKGLTLAARAEKPVLLRRVTFDLTGLPPKPAELDAFLADTSPDAFAKVIDRLLASRHYGERWGRHWLDVVRYADTAGESSDYPIPQAYLYRNYVIDSFNRDTAYDQFLREQIAGDLLPASSDAERRRNIIATGFIALSRRFSVDPDSNMHHTLEDTIDTLGRATMGLSLSCARCHDHKFDPVTMRDYYSLFGIFSSTTYPFPGSELKKRQRDLVPLIPQAEYQSVMAPFQGELAALDSELEQLRAEREAAKARAEGRPTSIEPKRTQLQLLEAFRGLRAKRDALQDRIPEVPMAYAVSEGKPANARVQKRGEPTDLGEEVPRGFIAALGGQALPPNAPSSGRRELADWIASPRNPLTARVMVNRIWQHHFGTGLVGTPNDFGKMGRPPTHPELLDWLAARFVEDGWSIKKLHRRILHSAVWQQSSDQGEEFRVQGSALSGQPPDPRAIDANNELLWHFPRLRLDAETTRDAMLFIGGRLDPLAGGPHPFPPQKEWKWTQHNPFTAVYETNERSVYVMQQRIRRHPFFATFDGADTNASTGARFVSTTPLQALFLMNDPFSHAQAQAFARRVMTNAPRDDRRIELATRLALGRPATAAETVDAILYLAAFRARVPGPQLDQADALAWASYARVLMSSNEFVYID